MIIADLAAKGIAALEASKDKATVDLAVRRMEVHQKHAWMLRPVCLTHRIERFSWYR